MEAFIDELPKAELDLLAEIDANPGVSAETRR